MAGYYDKYIFAQMLGYQDIATALANMSKSRFLELYNKQINIPVLLDDKGEVIQRRLLTGINENYYIYADGRCYSTYFGGRFLKPNKFQLKETHLSHYAYPITYKGVRRRLFINRLVYFYFAEHQYKDIDQMPIITYKNENTKDYRLDNLQFVSKREMGKKIKNNNPPDLFSKIRDTKSNAFVVKSLLKRGKTYAQIGNIFKCSDMSVYRFVKRNKLREELITK